MHTPQERRFAALIYLPKFIAAWAGNVEPLHQVWTREEKHDAYVCTKKMLGKYIDVKTCTDEEVADAFRECVLKLLDGRARVELIDVPTEPVPDLYGAIDDVLRASLHVTAHHYDKAEDPGWQGELDDEILEDAILKAAAAINAKKLAEKGGVKS